MREKRPAMTELVNALADPNDEDAWVIPSTAPVKSRSVGRGLPVPPVVPLVALLGMMFGITMGYRLAPAPATSPAAAHPTAVATTPAPTGVPTPAGPMWSFLSIIGPVEIIDPPEGGLKLDDLLTQLAGPGLRIPSSSVLSARVARYDQVSAVSPSSHQWVWVLVISGTSEQTVGTADCGIGSVSAEASAMQGCLTGHTTEILILDYMDGRFLEAQSWANS